MAEQAADRTARINAAWAAHRRNIIDVLRQRPTCVVWDRNPPGGPLTSADPVATQHVETLTFTSKWHREPRSGVHYLSVWCEGIEIMSATPMGRDYHE